MKSLFLTIAISLSIFANDIIIKESKCSVSQTVENFKKIVISKGLNIFTVIDHKKNAESVGMKLGESQEIIFGNPKAGTLLMQANATVGLDLPLRVLVYKDSDKKVKIAYRNGSWIKQEHELKDSKVIRKIDKAMGMFTTKAGICKK